MTAITAEESRALLETLTGYTQAPWEWRIEESDPEWGRTYSLAPGILWPDGSDGTPDGDDKDRANAHLIAAAPDLAAHLRAALDREAAALVQIGELAEQVGWLGNDLRRAEAERDAARAEVERLRTATIAEAVAVIETLETEWPHGWVPSHEAMLRIHALAQEPGQ